MNPLPPGTSLTAARRAAELAGLADGEVVDLLVVGLGVTGAGVALDAAARGLSVAAVDAHDLAFGTSRWSSKLVHGGLRYLAKLDIALAHESAAERGILMERTAPHLIRSLPMLLPLTPAASGAQAGLMRAAFLAGDVLRRVVGTSRATLPAPSRLSAAESLRLAPALRSDGLRGGLLSWDGQLVDDARLVVAIARTAAGLGARIVTRARVTALSGDGAEVRDELTGGRVTIRARTVVNAAGVWAGQLVPDIPLRPSRGTHLVLDAGALGRLDTALTVPVPGALARFVFALPQLDGRVYVGLTDEPVDGPVPDVPAAPESDVRFLLEVLGSVLDQPIRRADVAGTYAGLRPLLSTGDGQTADVSRRHAILTSPDGVITVLGGKLTTYRRMALDAVDAAVTAGGLAAPRSRSDRVPLVGAASRAALARVAAPRRLVQRYGTEAAAVAALADHDVTLAEPLTPRLEITGAELLWAVRHEGALDADDLLDRRTRIGLVPADRAAALPAARAILAGRAG